MVRKILLVEDYKDTRLLYKQILEDLGFDVIEAEDGYQAVEKFNQERPNLIIMDMSLPAMDGVTATRKIKELMKNNQIPIICITAFSDFYGQRVLTAGCNEIIIKPIDLKMLLTMISKYLKS